jgi:hypothetical protein
VGNGDNDRLEDEANGEPLGELLAEARLWLVVLEREDDPEWARALPLQARAVSEIAESLEDLESKGTSPTDHHYPKARERLAGYCVRMRRRYGGKRPQDLLDGL